MRCLATATCGATGQVQPAESSSAAGVLSCCCCCGSPLTHLLEVYAAHVGSTHLHEGAVVWWRREELYVWAEVVSPLSAAATARQHTSCSSATGPQAAPADLKSSLHSCSLQRKVAEQGCTGRPCWTSMGHLARVPPGLPPSSASRPGPPQPQSCAQHRLSCELRDSCSATGLTVQSLAKLPAAQLVCAEVCAEV